MMIPDTGAEMNTLPVEKKSERRGKRSSLKTTSRL
jgi:hypothetical protein